MNSIIDFIETKHLHKKGPLYIILAVYLFRYYKFPYFLQYYPRKKLTFQLIYFALGKMAIDTIYNTYFLIDK